MSRSLSYQIVRKIHLLNGAIYCASVLRWVYVRSLPGRLVNYLWLS